MRRLVVTVALAASLAGRSAAAPAPAPEADPAAAVAAIEERLLEAARSGDTAAALALAVELDLAHPALYRAGAWDYLAGWLAERGGDPDTAIRAWRRLADRGGILADRAALALAEQLEREHPRQALAMVVDFARRFPGSGVGSTAQVLAVGLRARTGDLLGAEEARRRLRPGLRRRATERLLALAVERGARGEARRLARILLGERATDDAAYLAASYLLASGTDRLDPAERWAVARALFTHRDFARAIDQLERVAKRSARVEDRAEALLLLGRAAMKAGDDATAARAFGRLAGLGSPWRERGSYQLGRLALACGDLDRATVHFAAAELAPGSLGAEAMQKRIRILTAAADLDQARGVAARIGERFGRGSSFARQAAIEVAGAALGQGDAAGALDDLDRAQPADPEARRDLGYWRGAALAAMGRTAEAAGEFRRVVTGFDLLSGLARGRLATLPRPAGDPVAVLLERTRAALDRGDPTAAARLAQAAIDGGATGEAESEALHLLQESYHGIREYAVVYDLDLAPPGAEPHPVGREPARHLEASSRLRRLGLDREAAEELRAAGVLPRDLQSIYQVAELARRGGDARTAVAYAEALRRRLPADFHPACLPPRVLRLLYPDAFGALVERVAGLRGVDPDLVRAIMREESRFDPAALSPAGARGLMQFIPETARRVGQEIGLERLDSAAIHQPEVAIPLGAAYLASLLRQFDGNEGAAIAAYNAGEEAAFDWLGRTGARLLDEFYREIEFAETRTYVERVLTTLAGYRARRAAESAN